MTLAFVIAGLLVPWTAAGIMHTALVRRRALMARLARAMDFYAEPLEEEGAAAGEAERLESFHWISWLLGVLGVRDRVERAVRRMDIGLSPGEFAATMATLWVTAPMLAWALGQPPMIIVAVLIVSLLTPQAVLNVRQAMRKKRFTEQLPDALDMMSSSLRVGHGLQRALQIVAAEAEDPMGSEMRRVMAEVHLGSPVDQALQRAAERVQCRELELLANAVAIQMQVGGNMAEVIDRVSLTLREREELQNEIKSLTAEGTMTAYVCIAMPPAMGLFVAYMNPDYMAPLLTTTFGHILLGATAVMQAMGAVVIKRMMKLEG